jgi:electron transfer flavoprotein beta subunit
MPLPALVTVVREIGEPRMPAIKHKMRARKQEIPTVGAAELDLGADEVGLQGSFTQVVRVFTPPPRCNREMLTGTVEEQTEQLLRHLKQARVQGL